MPTLGLYSVSPLEFLFTRLTAAVVGLTLMEYCHGRVFRIDFDAAHGAFVRRHGNTLVERGSRRHVPTQVDAPFEGFDASVRGVHVVSLAFVETRLTDVGTDPGVLLIDLGLARTQASTLIGDVGGVPTEADTSCQVLVTGLDTLVGTPIANLGHFETGIYALLHLLAEVEGFG